MLANERGTCDTRFETSLSTRLMVTDGDYNERSLFYYKIRRNYSGRTRKFLNIISFLFIGLEFQSSLVCKMA
jgi:hypothetical protein